MIRLAVFLLVACLSPIAAERWRVAHFYDEDRSSLTINDLQFASPRRGVAVGFITEGERTRPMSLVTADGGLSWTAVPTREVGLNLFFLDETHGWMVTDRGLWETSEAGRSWRKLKAPRGITRVHFLTPKRGFAVGPEKMAYETRDGKAWTPLSALEEIKTREAYTHFDWIVFVSSKVGMITGYNRPPRRSDEDLPAWIDPEKAQRRLDTPHLSVLLETRNGGDTWQASSMSMFGRITRVRVRSGGESLGLVEFDEGFPFYSEVYRIDWTTGKSERVFRQRSRAISDIALLQSGLSYLAGYEVTGRLSRLPVPGKVRILRSSNSSTWQEMEVDYRAVARRVILAPAGDRMFAATDSGMILRLVAE
jgi:photosystem II stability/assembly factor-like uncharacterized protein